MICLKGMKADYKFFGKLILQHGLEIFVHFYHSKDCSIIQGLSVWMTLVPVEESNGISLEGSQIVTQI